MNQDTKNPHAVALGRLGGLKGGPARASALSPVRRKEIAQNAAFARWGGTKALKTYNQEIKISIKQLRLVISKTKGKNHLIHLVREYKLIKLYSNLPDMGKYVLTQCHTWLAEKRTFDFIGKENEITCKVCQKRLKSWKRREGINHDNQRFKQGR